MVAIGPGSKHSVGSYVSGFFGAQSYAVTDGTQAFGLLPLPAVSRRESLGLFGITTGITAYVGMFCVTKIPVKGEVVVVSAAGFVLHLYSHMNYVAILCNIIIDIIISHIYHTHSWCCWINCCTTCPVDRGNCDWCGWGREEDQVFNRKS